ncbi:hypothetical protein EGT07_18845 [Herbaspirillum sp. HC18]|nr:hypothetical protein EGT07_18845 [Herbaspirillum sp. HC18]
MMVYTGLQTTYSDKRPFTYLFEILPGKATYLGEFLGYAARGDGALGVDKTIGAYFTVRDQRVRDLELLRKRGVEFSDGAVVSSVMTKAQSANSIFRRLDDAL